MNPAERKKAPCCINWPSVIEEELEEDPEEDPEKGPEEATQVFEDNFRREDDEEELKKKIK